MSKKRIPVLCIFATAIAAASVAYFRFTQASAPPIRQTAQEKPVAALPLITEQMEPSTLPNVPAAMAGDQKTAVKESSKAKTIDELVAEAKDAMSRRAYDKASESLQAAYAATAEPDQRMAIGQMLYECLIRIHDYEGALALGRELLTLSPSPEERLLLTRQLAALLHQMGKGEEAEALLDQTMANEQDPTARAKYEAQLRGIWRHTPGRTDEVVSNLTDRLEANPKDEAALRELGNIYLKSRRDYRAAQPIYEQLVALHPEDPQTQNALLGIYKETRNFDGIRSIYENQLAQAGGSDPALRFQIAQTELQAGRGDEAVTYAEEYLSGENATPFQLQMLSAVYDKAGRKDAALAVLDTAIGRETNDQQRVSMQFQKSDMLVWNKQYDAAELLLRSIIQAAGGDQQTISRAKGEIIRIYEMQGKMSELNL